MKYVKLNNGVEMPAVGLGVFTFSPEDAEKAVESALKSGYHLIDMANSMSTSGRLVAGSRTLVSSAKMCLLVLNSGRPNTKTRTR